MPACIPFKDMRDTAAFSAPVEASPEPVTVTKNNHDGIRGKDYDALRQAQARAAVMERIHIAEQDRIAHNHRDANAALAALRERYDL